MDANKLNKILDRKNEQLEEQAVEHAKYLIDNIAALQQQKSDIDKKIADSRKQLKEIEIAQVDAKAIFGE